MKSNHSIYFRDTKGEEYFLFQVLNLGKDTDELKFVFNDPNSGTAVKYSEIKGKADKSDIIRLCPEISYHSDGSLLQKSVGYSPRHSTVYKNPHGEGWRRTPLENIGFWEPFLEYKVVDYRICKKVESTNPIFLPNNSILFQGNPFECIFYLGSKDNVRTKGSDDHIAFRLKEMASSVDLLVVVKPTTYSGEEVQIGDSDIKVWSTNNIIEVVERAN